MNKEHAEQVVVIQWWAAQHALYGLPEFALYAIPNAAKRSFQLAAYCKAEGLRSGIPDLFLAVPRFDIDAGGLYLEMKIKPGKPSETQLVVIDSFRQLGYHVVICWSADEAIRAIRGYLRGREKC